MISQKYLITIELSPVQSAYGDMYIYTCRARVSECDPVAAKAQAEQEQHFRDTLNTVAHIYSLY